MDLSAFAKAHEQKLQLVAHAVRSLAMDAVLAAGSGHVGLPLGGAEIGAFLYFACMKHDPRNPDWESRDRFVLSAGHGSALQYALLHLSGYAVSIDDLRHFRQLGSRTPGHPEFGHTVGVETTTGPLGQGFANAVGIALDERMNSVALPHRSWRTWVLVGDGCLMEGVGSEAASLAGHLRLNRLIAFYDNNGITIDGPATDSWSEDVVSKFRALGWNCIEADGHSFESLAEAVQTAQAHSEVPTSGPTLISCRTRPGRGSPRWEGKPKVHGNPMNAEDVAEAKERLGITNLTPFWVPEEVYAACESLLAASRPSQGSTPAPANQNPEKVTLPLSFWEENRRPMATRAASGKALVQLAKLCPALVGGSADLASSTLTTLPDSRFVAPGRFDGRNIAFGVREHAMAAIANGLALGGNWRPFVSTFLVFSDYMRPAVRLSALMHLPVIYIFTHDSIYVGEDGPTHQPVEHAASLRAIPDLAVVRPADAWETFAAWEQALARTDGPTALLLTRQDVEFLENRGAALRTLETVRQGVAQGGYVVKEWREELPTRLVLAASGSEVSLALQAARLLEEEGIMGIRVVSVPDAVQLTGNPALLEELLPLSLPLAALEAGSPWGARELVGRRGLVLGISHFGASGKPTDVAKFMGFTPDQVAVALKTHISPDL